MQGEDDRRGYDPHPGDPWYPGWVTDADDDPEIVVDLTDVPEGIPAEEILEEAVAHFTEPAPPGIIDLDPEGDAETASAAPVIPLREDTTEAVAMLHDFVGDLNATSAGQLQHATTDELARFAVELELARAREVADRLARWIGEQRTQANGEAAATAAAVLQHVATVDELGRLEEARGAADAAVQVWAEWERFRQAALHTLETNRVESQVEMARSQALREELESWAADSEAQASELVETRERAALAHVIAVAEHGRLGEARLASAAAVRVWSEWEAYRSGVIAEVEVAKAAAQVEMARSRATSQELQGWATAEDARRSERLAARTKSESSRAQRAIATAADSNVAAWIGPIVFTLRGSAEGAAAAAAMAEQQRRSGQIERAVALEINALTTGYATGATTAATLATEAAGQRELHRMTAQVAAAGTQRAGDVVATVIRERSATASAAATAARQVETARMAGQLETAKSHFARERIHETVRWLAAEQLVSTGVARSAADKRMERAIAAAAADDVELRSAVMEERLSAEAAAATARAAADFDSALASRLRGLDLMLDGQRVVQDLPETAESPVFAHEVQESSRPWWKRLVSRRRRQNVAPISGDDEASDALVPPSDLLEEPRNVERDMPDADEAGDTVDDLWPDDSTELPVADDAAADEPDEDGGPGDQASAVDDSDEDRSDVVEPAEVVEADDADDPDTQASGGDDSDEDRSDVVEPDDVDEPAEVVEADDADDPDTQASGGDDSDEDRSDVVQPDDAVESDVVHDSGEDHSDELDGPDEAAPDGDGEAETQPDHAVVDATVSQSASDDDDHAIGADELSEPEKTDRETTVDESPEAAPEETTSGDPDLLDELEEWTDPGWGVAVPEDEDEDEAERQIEFDWDSDAMDDIPDFAAFTSGEYVQTSTQEYAGLAEAVARAATEEHELSPVAAEIPGLERGMIDLDDVVAATGADPGAPVAPRRSDLALRIATGLGLLALFVASMAAQWSLGLLVLVVLMVAAGEFYLALVPARYHPLTLFGLVGTGGLLAGVWLWGAVALPVALMLSIFAVVLFYALVPRSAPLVNSAVTLLVVVWVGALGSFAFLIIDSPDYRWLLGAVVVTVAVMDVGQFFVGRRIGRHALAPSVSPKKTVEGLLGGIVVAVVAGYLWGFAPPLDHGVGVVLGLAIAAVAPFGDLGVSVVKRALGLKDMGTILPGHGGVLDRIDAMLVALPVAWMVFAWAGLL